MLKKYKNLTYKVVFSFGFATIIMLKSQKGTKIIFDGVCYGKQRKFQAIRRA